MGSCPWGFTALPGGIWGNFVKALATIHTAVVACTRPPTDPIAGGKAYSYTPRKFLAKDKESSWPTLSLIYIYISIYIYIRFLFQYICVYTHMCIYIHTQYIYIYMYIYI